MSNSNNSPITTAPNPPDPYLRMIPSLRQKPKMYSVGITAGAEEAKYHAKYKELKHKVKEIEADNDKLQYKVLQTKRNVQRMKLERAILYERLSAIPQSPDLQERHGTPRAVPAASTSIIRPANQYPRDSHTLPRDSEPQFVEYSRPPTANARLSVSDTRSIAYDQPSTGPGLAQQHNTLSLRGMSGSRGSNEHRQLPPLPHMATLPAVDVSRSRSSLSHSHSHNASPSVRDDNHSHERSRSRSDSRRHSMYPENNMPRVQQPQTYPPASISDHERPRIQEYSDHPGQSTDLRSSQQHVPMASLSPQSHSEDARSTGRIHAHQRLGPGTYINRDDNIDREREFELDREREQDWERERERYRGRQYQERDASGRPPSPQFSLPAREYQDYSSTYTSRIRDDPGYYTNTRGSSGAGGYQLSRSESPGSVSAGSVNDGASRPNSRGGYYESEPIRSFRLRPVNPTSEERDFVHDGSSQSRDRDLSNGGSGGGAFTVAESHTRKRNRNEMDVDEVKTEGPAGGSNTYLQEDRVAKRYHRLENQEDDRMGA